MWQSSPHGVGSSETRADANTRESSLHVQASANISRNNDPTTNGTSVATTSASFDDALKRMLSSDVTTEAALRDASSRPPNLHGLTISHSDYNSFARQSKATPQSSQTASRTGSMKTTQSSPYRTAPSVQQRSVKTGSRFKEHASSSRRPQARQKTSSEPVHTTTKPVRATSATSLQSRDVWGPEAKVIH